MFEDRGNWIGIGLLILCGLSAGTMLGYIKAGEVAQYDGPRWLGIAISVLFIGLMLFGVMQAVRGKHLGDDLRRPRRWWRRNGG